LINPDLGKKIERILGKGKRETVEEEGEEKQASQPTTTVGKIYVKALSLHSLEELDKIKDEIKLGNILIVKVEPLAEKSIEDVKRAINELSEFIGSIGGDIARLGEERIVLTPPNIQIWKEKTQASM